MRNRVSSATRLIVAASGVSSVAFGSEPVGPDITVGDITGGLNYGAVGEIHAYAFGFTACNAGDAPIDWQADTNRHPVFATQLYRLADGQFEQIGLAWAFHEFFPLELNLCGDCTPSGFTDSLGAGCGNANSAGLGGAQQTLGPRTEINALRLPNGTWLSASFVAMLTPLPTAANASCEPTPADVRGPYHLPPEEVPAEFPARPEACVPHPTCNDGCTPYSGHIDQTKAAHHFQLASICQIDWSYG